MPQGLVSFLLFTHGRYSPWMSLDCPFVAFHHHPPSHCRLLLKKLISLDSSISLFTFILSQIPATLWSLSCTPFLALPYCLFLSIVCFPGASGVICISLCLSVCWYTYLSIPPVTWRESGFKYQPTNPLSLFPLHLSPSLSLSLSLLLLLLLLLFLLLLPFIRLSPSPPPSALLSFGPSISLPPYSPLLFLSPISFPFVSL